MELHSEKKMDLKREALKELNLVPMMDSMMGSYLDPMMESMMGNLLGILLGATKHFG